MQPAVLAAAALRRGATAATRRHLAIMPTVKTASDTSKKDFPAPSHVSLSAEAVDLSRQLREFYSNPDSVFSLPEEARKSLQLEVAKKVKAIPDSELTEEWAMANLDVPAKIRLGDNPLFEAYKSDRIAADEKRKETEAV